MDANDASVDAYVRRHLDLCHALRAGLIYDPERTLFLKLLDDEPVVLAATPYLYDVSWCGKQCDLLFTDGRGRWCAVEVKAAPIVEGTGRQRKHGKTKYKRLLTKLVGQTRFALGACQRRFTGIEHARAKTACARSLPAV